jgi:hypothetical protein
MFPARMIYHVINHLGKTIVTDIDNVFRQTFTYK